MGVRGREIEREVCGREGGRESEWRRVRESDGEWGWGGICMEGMSAYAWESQQYHYRLVIISISI